MEEDADTTSFRGASDNTSDGVVLDLKPAVNGAVASLGHPLLCGGGDEPHSLSAKQVAALSAVCDALLPSIPSEGDAKDLYELSASAAGVPQKVAGLLCKWLDPSALGLMSLVLWLLSSRLGTLLLGGRFSLTSRFPFVQKFGDLPLERQESILRSWCLSSILLLRVIFKILKSLTVVVYFAQVDSSGRNKTWNAIGYTGPDPRRARHKQPEGESEQDTRPLAKHVVDLREAAEQGVSRVEKVLTAAGCSLLGEEGISHLQDLHRQIKPKLKPNPGKEEQTVGIDCDAVVVGSGSGGGVIAGVLAQAGYKVVVLEKGSYFARQDFSLLELPSYQALYEGGGLLSTSDGAIGLIAGSTVGGGSTVNWSASFRTPPHVLREWSQDLHLPLFAGERYQHAMDRVCERAGVQTGIEREGLQNAMLRRGCEKLGYHAGTIPRNAPPDHYCGWCGFGCASGRKQSTAETWLVDAARAGATILAGCRAEIVLHSPGGGRRSRRARGVSASLGSGIRLLIRAKATVVACGSLNTPPLLLKSGFRNPNIGKHLHLHPVPGVWGHFPDQDDVHYEGAIMSAYSTVAADWEGSGYGALLEVPTLHPGSFAIMMPWTSARDFKARMHKFARTVHFISLCRDTGSGSVQTAPHNGGPLVHYRLAPLDEQNILDGCVAALRALVAAGATEIGTHQADGEVLDVRHSSPEAMDAFLQRVRARGLKNLRSPILTAHQMGSCRMGADPRSSVVDQDGHAWDALGLFLGDACVFPTATGVNPMITVQSIAYCTAQSVKDFLKTAAD